MQLNEHQNLHITLLNGLKNRVWKSRTLRLENEHCEQTLQCLFLPSSLREDSSCPDPDGLLGYQVVYTKWVCWVEV